MSVQKNTRWLWQALILSAGLNIVFLLLFYTTIFRKDLYKLQLFSGPLVARSCRVQKIPEDFLDYLSESSLEDLYCLLDENRLFYGRPIKLWALSVAMHTYNIDVASALSHPLVFTELRSGGKTWLLPNLDEKDYCSIRQYLSCQRYPFTSQGLFLTLAKNIDHGLVDEECLYHFCLTEEFLYLRTLLCGAEEQVSTIAALAHMVIRNGEKVFFSLCDKHNRSTAISDQQRRKVLCTYVDLGEPLAALLLLVHDEDWVIHEFTDEVLQSFVFLLPKESPYSKKFISRLLSSPRCHIYQHHEAVIDKDSPIKYEEYVVKEGESLWLIARRFGITVEEIMRENHMNHHRLMPGTRLKLPLKSS
ncbi:hypothetical protein BOKEGFJH_00923 [Chlamydia avium]|uniref:LysM domain-containing protein n=2 Tax=Chlamydia avium TaxID=1457141 RepID=W8JGY8_9CHLA|nr:LysM peptidoglycan-binding domain-containing protein [Chlamydia avium]AHK63796.1 Uncharacterized protein M832_09490 [Chlamydia avium 10DC88]EPP36554.1 lysM domain protein [Chlamydia psittaci 10_743_SC13]EPP38463.1 lysM domain protein [Chlamydia avium]VVT43377.1 hypothetical protein BOKEGFJH_00923 [Chlamydia avium]